MKIFTDRKDKGEKYGNVWAEREKGKKKGKGRIILRLIIVFLLLLFLLVCFCFAFTVYMPPIPFSSMVTFNFFFMNKDQCSELFIFSLKL